MALTPQHKDPDRMGPDHLMIDLETLGTRHNAPILQIGAVFFDPNDGSRGGRFLSRIDPEDAFRHGVASASAIGWWMTQSDDARLPLMSGGTRLAKALADLSAFISTWGPTDPSTLRVWGNGATFDISILDYAHHAVGLKPPWGFRAVRDCRTIEDVAEGLTPRLERPAELRAHDALDDALWQISWVSTKWQALRRQAAAGPAHEALA